MLQRSVSPTALLVFAACTSSRRLYVAIPSDVAVVDLDTRDLVDLIPVKYSVPLTMGMQSTRLYAGLEMIDPLRNVVTGTLGLPPEREIYAVAIAPAGDVLYVASQSAAGAAVAVLDARSGSWRYDIGVDAPARNLAVNHAGSRLYVSSGGGVAVVDLGTSQVIATVPVADATAGQYVGALAVHPDDHEIYVAIEPQVNIAIIDGATNSVGSERLPVAGSAGLGTDPSGTVLYAGTTLPPAFARIDIPSRTITRASSPCPGLPPPLPGDSDTLTGFAIDPLDGAAYALVSRYPGGFGTRFSTGFVCPTDSDDPTKVIAFGTGMDPYAAVAR